MLLFTGSIEPILALGELFVVEAEEAIYYVVP